MLVCICLCDSEMKTRWVSNSLWVLVCLRTTLASLAYLEKKHVCSYVKICCRNMSFMLTTVQEHDETENLTYWWTHWSLIDITDTECLKKGVSSPNFALLGKSPADEWIFEWGLYRTHPDRWQHQKHNIDSSRQNTSNVAWMCLPPPL